MEKTRGKRRVRKEKGEMRAKLKDGEVARVEIMPSSIPLLHSVSAIAYGFRYRAPLKHTCLFYTHQLHTLQPPNVPLFSSSFCRVPNPNFFTGNSLFSRMEVLILSMEVYFIFLIILFYFNG